MIFIVLLFAILFIIGVLGVIIGTFIAVGDKISPPANNYNPNYRAHGTRLGQSQVCGECHWNIMRGDPARQSKATGRWVHERCPAKLNKNPSQTQRTVDKVNGITPAQRTEMDLTEQKTGRPSKLQAQVRQDETSSRILSASEYEAWANSPEHDPAICVCCIDDDDE